MGMGNKNMKNVRRKLSFNLLQIDKCQQLDIMRNESVSRVRGEKSQITEIVQLVQHCTIPRQALSRLWAQGMRGNDNSFSEYSLVSFVDWAEVECLHYGRHSFTDCADIAHSLVRGDWRTVSIFVQDFTDKNIFKLTHLSNLKCFFFCENINNAILPTRTFRINKFFSRPSP